MDEIPRISIDEAHQLDDPSRRRLVNELRDLADTVACGEFGTIPPGMPSTTWKGEPVQGVRIDVTFTRPGPLP